MPKPAREKARTNINFGKEQYERLERLADRTGISISEWVRRFVDSGLDEMEEKEANRRQ